MTAFQRYAPALAIFHASAFAMALSFGIEVARGGSPITPELYGPSVHAIPALAWVTMQIFGSALSVIGLLSGGRFGAALALVGGVVSGFMYAALAVMASEAAEATLLRSGAMFSYAPISIAGACLAFLHMTGGRDE